MANKKNQNTSVNSSIKLCEILSQEIMTNLTKEIPGLFKIIKTKASRRDLIQGIVSNLRSEFIKQEQEFALDKANEKIGQALNKGKDDDIEHQELDNLDDADLATIKKLESKGVRVIYPNLKYRKPKYNNVNEILKYVESEGGSGDGIKLVIMNFND